MAYSDVKDAPSSLIELYETSVRSKIAPESEPNRKSNGQRKQGALNASTLLYKLLSDTRMKQSWRRLSKRQLSASDYETLYETILEAARLARRGIIDQTSRKSRYRKIAELSEALIDLIAEPEYSGQDKSGYRGELDLKVYELLPDDLARILGADSYAGMKADERIKWAGSQLPRWPTMVDTLKQLAIRANALGNAPVLSQRRSRRFLKEQTEEELMIQTKSRLFACYLDDQLQTMGLTAIPLATIRSIALVIYGEDVPSMNSLKKAIRDYRHKVST